MKKQIFPFLLLGLLFMLAGTETAQKPAERPNIIFFLADDLGYGSVNAYGADENLVRTPHIDRIAWEGMRFNHAHTPASVCSPTRYGFLMGRYPCRTSMKYGVVGPKGPLLPDPDRITIADWLKERGYHTAIIGKWHLGYGTKDPVDYSGVLSPGPLDLGFDYQFAVPQNHGDMTGVYIENEKVYGLRSKKVQPFSRTYYGTPYIGIDAPQRVNKNVMKDLTNRAVDWIKRQSKNEPFFLYFAAVAVHHPITPSDEMRGISDCGPYGDFIQDLDQSVGRILETLDYMGMADNTIFVFTSDNGGEIPNNKPESPEIQAVNAGLAINGSLRGDKHTIWQGGTNVPFIVRWPGKVKEGSQADDMINIIDMFATVAEILDGEVPDPEVAAPDSYSFLSSLIPSKKSRQRTAMVTADVNGMHAIQMDGWKYIDDELPSTMPADRAERLKKNLKPQLYNLSGDPSEENNLYEFRPEMVRKLKTELNNIRNSERSRN